MQAMTLCVPIGINWGRSVTIHVTSGRLSFHNKPQFQVLPAPDNEEIARLAASLAVRIPRFLQSRCLGTDSRPEESDPFARDQPWLAGYDSPGAAA